MATYHELVIAGNYDLAKGFVTGFLSGKAFPIPAVFSQECGVRRVSLGEKMLAWTGVQEHAAHVIVEGGIAGDLIREITAGEAGLDLKVISNRPIRTASFDFHFKVFAKAYRKEIDTIFEGAPSSLKIAYEQAPKEKIDPDARGVEAYTPTHDYEYSAKGSVGGTFPDLFPFFEKLLEHPLVEVDEVDLMYAD